MTNMNLIYPKVQLILLTTIIGLTHFSCQNTKWDEDIFADAGQTEVEQFDDNIREGDAIKTADLLEAIGWERIKANKHRRNDYIIETGEGKILDEFIFNLGRGGAKNTEYGRRHIEHFRIKSYKGLVIEYFKQTEKDGNTHTSNYFNKALWLEYVEEALPAVPEEFKLTLKQDPQRLRNYYALLGLNTGDEYGWLCQGIEYTLPPERRRAVLELVREKNTYLLRKLIDYPDALVKLYAMEAMIYLDRKTRRELAYLNARSKELFPDYTNEHYGGSTASLTRDRLLLTDAEWEQIHTFRESNQQIKTCGNIGTYKILESTTKELLSEEVMEEVFKMYEDYLMAGPNALMPLPIGNDS